MHGFVMGLFYLVQSVASLLGAALYAFCTGVLPWIRSSNDKAAADLGDLDNYFYLLAAIMFVTWLIFIVLSVKFDFKYRNESLATVRSNRRSRNKHEGSLSKTNNSSSVITWTLVSQLIFMGHVPEPAILTSCRLPLLVEWVDGVVVTWLDPKEDHGWGGLEVWSLHVLWFTVIFYVPI